jgi:hypothetical protein
MRDHPCCEAHDAEHERRCDDLHQPMLKHAAGRSGFEA